MLTNNIRRTYASLATAKGRRVSGLFMAQGTKCVLDTLPHFAVEALLSTAEWAETHPAAGYVNIVKQIDLDRITSLSTPPQVIAVYRIPDSPEVPDAGYFNENLTLALDCVQDPGNLGTILRVCDWMGVDTVLASTDTADVWQPKVVQSTMGAISRVRVHYCNVAAILRQMDAPVYGTFLDGNDIYSADLHDCGIVVMGNEGRGISPEVASAVNSRLLIPSYPAGRSTSESLNVAVATAITLSEFRRRHGS